MSELYEHLKKLEEKERRVRDEGAMASVPILDRQKTPRLRRSPRWLLGIPAVLVILGFLTVFAVMELKKKTRPPEPAVQTGAAPSHAEENAGRKNEETPTPSPLVLLETWGNEKAGSAGVSPSHDGGIMLSSSKKATSGISEEKKPLETDDRTLGPSEQPGSGVGTVSKGDDERERPVPPMVSKTRRASCGEGAVRRVDEKPRTRRTAAAKEKGPDLASGKEPQLETSRQLLVIAEEARQAGNWEEAERGYREYLATKNDPAVMNNLGAVLMARGLYAEAEQVLSRAYAQSPDPDIAANLCVSFWVQGKKRPCLPPGGFHEGQFFRFSGFARRPTGPASVPPRTVIPPVSAQPFEKSF